MEHQQHHEVSRYDPPEKVVPPAFAELLNRLSRARLSRPSNPNLPQEESVLFNYGVAKRRRVLEQTLLLILGQWITYRQVFTKFTTSRPLRIAYSFTSFLSTGAFLRYRASQVSNDLFAHIATQDTSSALANEARIVLAELEGPGGPYFKSVCQSRGFKDLLDNDGFQDTLQESDNVHPQLKLTPRLLTDDVANTTHNTRVVGPGGGAGGLSQSNHPQIPPPTRKNIWMKRQNDVFENSRDNMDREISDRNGNTSPFRMRSNNNNNNMDENYNNNESNENMLRPQLSPRSSNLSTKSDQQQTQYNEEVGRVDEWGKSFNFSTSGSEFNNDDSDTEDDNGMGGMDIADHGMTPSQRRAAERRDMRMAARTRGFSSSSRPNDS